MARSTKSAASDTLYLIEVRPHGRRDFGYMTEMGEGDRHDAMEFTREQAEYFVSLYAEPDLEYRIVACSAERN